jgi:hypothetical protein
MATPSERRPAAPVRRAVQLLSAVAAVAAVAVSACAQPAPPPPSPPPSGGGFSAGITIGSMEDGSGLETPLYPGAVPYQDRPENKSGAQVNLWGGDRFGFRLAAGKFQSRDDVDRIGRFYRRALVRYGTPLDCGAPDAPRGKHKEGGPLTCEDDKPEAGGQLYKVGLPKNFRVVSVKPLPDGTTQIEVVRVSIR